MSTPLAHTSRVLALPPELPAELRRYGQQTSRALLSNTRDNKPGAPGNPLKINHLSLRLFSAPQAGAIGRGVAA